MSVAVVTVKLTPTEHALALELSTFGRYLSVSDVLRAGIMLVAQERKQPPKLLQLAQAERNQHEPRLRRQRRLPLLEASPEILGGKERSSRPDKSAPKKTKKEQTQCKPRTPKSRVDAHIQVAASRSQASDSVAPSIGTDCPGKTAGESITHGHSGVKAASRSRGSAKCSRT